MAGKPWTKQEEAMIGTLPDVEVAKAIGRSKWAVLHKRQELGIEAYHGYKKPLSKAQIKRLGKEPDRVLAEKWGLSRVHVTRSRLKLDIPCFRGNQSDRQ